MLMLPTISISYADINYWYFEEPANLVVQKAEVSLNPIETLFIRHQLRFV